MTVPVRQLFAEPLTGGRWQVDFAVIEEGVRAAPAEVVLAPLHRGSREARIEIATPPHTGQPHWRLVIALGTVGSAPPVYELIGSWSGRVDLSGARMAEPSPLRPVGVHDAGPQAGVDYRSRDFASLRAMLLRMVADRVDGRLLGHPVAQSTALVELLAYLGDNLSYAQDAIATEAYLATARRRVSVTRHAEVLDYRVGERTSARCWVRVEASTALRLPAHTKLLTRVARGGSRVAPSQVGAAIRGGALVFETLHPVDLQPGDRRLRLDDRRHPCGRLASGATAATVVGRCPSLTPGSLVLIEPAPELGGGPGHVVSLERARAFQRDGTRLTELAWPVEDALPASVTLADVPLCVRLDNLVIAEHGESQPWQPLPASERGRRYWPRLPAQATTWTRDPGRLGRQISATAAVRGNGRDPRATVELREGHPPHRRYWRARPTLLDSGPLAADYVVESDVDGWARLRFGDGVNGLRPAPGAALQVRQRIGGGSAGNVSPGTIAHVVTEDVRIVGVANPTAAVGGEDAEPLGAVRLNAPQAFRVTSRAVSPPDYVAQALTIDAVRDASASIRSTGSWPIALVYVHTGAWPGPSRHVLDQVRRRIAPLQPVGVGLDVRAAVPAPVTAELEIMVSSGWSEALTGTAVDRALRGGLLEPSTFGFGDPLHASRVIALVAAIPGVVDVRLRRFGWAGQPAADALPEQLLPPFGRIIRIDNDPARPERGSLSYILTDVPA